MKSRAWWTRRKRAGDAYLAHQRRGQSQLRFLRPIFPRLPNDAVHGPIINKHTQTLLSACRHPSGGSTPRLVHCPPRRPRRTPRRQLPRLPLGSTGPFLNSAPIAISACSLNSKSLRISDGLHGDHCANRIVAVVLPIHLLGHIALACTRSLKGSSHSLHYSP